MAGTICRTADPAESRSGLAVSPRRAQNGSMVDMRHRGRRFLGARRVVSMPRVGKGGRRRNAGRDQEPNGQSCGKTSNDGHVVTLAAAGAPLNEANRAARSRPTCVDCA
jgi:hypothetical protein